MPVPLRPLICVTACATLATGCVITTTDEDAASARLPTGVTLLDSDRSECAGPVAIDESSIADSERADVVVGPGQNATFAIDVDTDDDANDEDDDLGIEVEWTCVGAAALDERSAECPAGTSHLRVTRASTGDELLIECFGDADDRTARR